MATDEFTIELGKRLKRERCRLGLTQEKLSEMLDISVREYRRYETGKASFSITILLNLVNLGADLDYIVNGRTIIDSRISEILNRLPDEKYEEVLERFDYLCDYSDSTVDHTEGTTNELMINVFKDILKMWTSVKDQKPLRKRDFWVFTANYEKGGGYYSLA